MYLPCDKFKMQHNLEEVSNWTKHNLMLLNEKKSAYIIFSRSKTQFSTRLTLNEVTLGRLSVIKVLGIWLQDDLKWNYNTKQICIKAYSRMNILNKLKHVGICESDLLTIYKLFIRSICEYCSVVYHTSLTKELSDKIEAIQSTALKIILAERYVDYKSSLVYFKMECLSQRRQNHMERFVVKCTKDTFNQSLFPRNQNERGKDLFPVNFARTGQYLNSTIPQIQRLLNR